MIKKLLIANRGEIAVRVARTAHRLGIETVAVYSDADADALHVKSAGGAYRLGPPPAVESYLDIAKVIAAAKASGADAVHPGYGFLSENPAFVEAVEAAGLIFVGPPAAAIRAMGLKDAAKARMQAAGVPIVPGYHGDTQDPAFLKAQADEIGYPVLIKARAGGGGKGMRRVDDPAEFQAALDSAVGEARASFGDDAVLIEKYVSRPRHIEIQVFADAHGNTVHLFERDCSLQRRHQKVIEEAPAPGMTEEMRALMGVAAVKAAQAVGYQNAGTVEFIADASEGLRPDRFYFMEMNTRLQVEHPVTEAITGLDLVEWQLRVASGEPLPKRQEELQINGWAFEARLYAEDPAKGFLPQTGKLERLTLPENIARVDAGVRQGDQVTPFYDPMIGKIISHGLHRESALANLQAALAATDAIGCETNLAFLQALARHAGFASGDVDTGLIDRDLAGLTSAPDPSPEVWAAAALASLGLGRSERRYGGKIRDPFKALTDWRLWGDALHVAPLICNGAAHEVVLRGGAGEGYSASLPGGGSFGPFQPLRTKRGYQMTTPERVISVDVAVKGGVIDISYAGARHRFQIPDPLAVAEDAAAGGDQITAPMPGLVKKLDAKPGQSVAEGDLIAIMEAMKMELRLTAPRDGVIAELLAAEGDQVEDGAVLARLEPSA